MPSFFSILQTYNGGRMYNASQYVLRKRTFHSYGSLVSYCRILAAGGWEIASYTSTLVLNNSLCVRACMCVQTLWPVQSRNWKEPQMQAETKMNASLFLAKNMNFTVTLRVIRPFRKNSQEKNANVMAQKMHGTKGQNRSSGLNRWSYESQGCYFGPWL